MNKIEHGQEIKPFQELGPNRIFQMVEDALEVPFTNLFRPLNSYINRVYELEQEDGEGIIVKFYRPGRWSKKAILDEHHFLLELAAVEVPVIPPMKLGDNTTLGSADNIHFALYPKCGGRSCDEFNDDQWLELGRLLGRTHLVGAQHPASERVKMAPDQSTRDHIEFILASDCLQDDQRNPFKDITNKLLDEICPFFEEVDSIRIHGDCHFSNIIYRPGESFFLIDFDDLVMGPPVQDFWMLLPGYGEESFVEIDTFLEGYETFYDFDRRSLRLIEPLRAMRYIHYMAWCTHQVIEDGETLAVPDFGSRFYWQTEIRELADQLERIKKTPSSFGNM